MAQLIQHSPTALIARISTTSSADIHRLIANSRSADGHAIISIRLVQNIRQVIDLSRALEGRVDAFRAAVAPVEEAQRGIEGAESHLSATGPEDALLSLHKRLTASEGRTAAQEGQNRAADLQERVQEMRERQADLRNRIGEVVAERRTLEPIFNELRERQKKIESSLSELELDDNKNG